LRDYVDSDIRGKASEARVRAYLLENGYVTSTPDCDTKYDLVVEVGGGLLKIQVKRGYADGSRDDTLRVNMYDQNQNGQANDVYETDDVDAFVIHDPINNELYWLWFDEAPSSELRRKFDSLTKHKITHKLD